MPSHQGHLARSCEQCGAVTLLASSRPPGLRTCMHCGSVGKSALDVDDSRLQTFIARLSRTRLRWDHGYVSDSVHEMAASEVQAVTLSADGQRVTLHATRGDIHYFDDSGMEDGEGFRIFRERPVSEDPVDDLPVPANRPLLVPADTFDYVVWLGPGGREGVCRLREVEPRNPDRRSDSLVGASPRLQITPAGMLPGGGALSPLCDLVRPAVSGSRVTLSRRGATDGSAMRASFLLSQGLVDLFRAGDEVHFTLTPRGGLGVSLFRGADLMVALGAVSAVPLGNLRVAVRRDRLSRNAPAPGFSSSELPLLHTLEITTRDEPPRKPNDYRIQVWYGAWPPPEDAGECVSIVRPEFCPLVDAYASTHLLARSDALQIER